MILTMRAGSPEWADKNPGVIGTKDYGGGMLRMKGVTNLGAFRAGDLGKDRYVRLDSAPWF